MASRLAGIGELAAGVAHEINNPVGFVNSNTFSMKKYFSKIKTMLDFYQNLIEDNRHKEFMQAYIDKLDILKMELKLDKAIKNIDDIIDENITGLERIAKIVQDLKTFAHFDQEMNSDVNINQILDNTLNLVNNEIKYKATVKKNYTELPPIKCNEGQISQIFANILVNAAQAIEKEGIIEISTYHIDSKIFIEIKDNGCGMPKENLNKIFNAFFTTKKTGKGTGLGLSIVYKIIEKHKGDIKVESELGKGTKFTIILPVCASACINDKTEIQKIETKEEETKVPCIDYYL